ncbi:MAG: Cell wall hydrolase/autolysin [Candidatus Jorgensenbacteria bacterium GW2011_GWA1_48_11]|uniref:Cell wall hydrolase/autolysin n=1 Tax=Candidatus Jorgensenbacteria bacterium GW2011_GWA1_48_11 TaxID=1618660 RepID=A0A0G1UB21_9BACT|nr:MAG: Cell wall hydrolase/autolysin [Candidatus Jorgensenbacteria bacterium GW2011_GWA1_48_11]KKW12757.1 MAG: Cell wall hydrolase/autolysin [Candidatus Jorgensenbacteria bacterium GW2011_GWB1_49_9]
MKVPIRSVSVLVALAVATSLVQAQTRARSTPNRGSLYGWVVVLDPGHGGTDPGSSRIHNGQRVAESDYVYDVALRVRRLATARQAVVFMTLTSGVGERNWNASRVFPDARTERFALDQSVVRAGTAGLSKRLSYGNRVGRRYPNHRQAWISIHFDMLRDGEIGGVRIIVPDTALRLARALDNSFGNARRLRDDNPVVYNGDQNHGIRRLFVLGPGNRIREKALIELGNFNNQTDLWRIRDWRVREAYARAIVQALEDW